MFGDVVGPGGAIIRMRNAVAAITALVMFACTAIADDRSTFQSLWMQATEDTNCKPPADYADYILVSCDSENTLWYFTKSNHPAHPAVIKRVMQQAADGTWTAHEDGKSFARASAQPAFKAWYEDLDRQMREELKRRDGSGPASSN